MISEALGGGGRMLFLLYDYSKRFIIIIIIIVSTVMIEPICHHFITFLLIVDCAVSSDTC